MDEITAIGTGYAAFRKTGSKISWHKLETEHDTPHIALLDSARYVKTGLMDEEGDFSPDSFGIKAYVTLHGAVDHKFFITGRVGSQYALQNFDKIKARAQILSEIGCEQSFASALGDYGRFLLTTEITRFNLLNDPREEHICYLTNVVRFDGLGQDEIYVTVVRGVCANTQAAGEFDAKNRKTMFRARHHAGIDQKIEDGFNELTKRDASGVFGKEYIACMASAKNAQDTFEALVQKRLTTQQVDAFVNHMLPATPKLQTVVDQKRADLYGAIPVDPTAYDAYNAVTDSNKRAPVRKVKNLVAAQAAQDLVGTGSDKRALALNWLVAA